MTPLLLGKSAIVTGASRGIGAAAARVLAAEGASVLLTARTTSQIEAVADEISATGGTAHAMACDVADYASVADVIAHCRTTFGSVDILINNAGVIDPIARIADSDPADWGTVVDINLKGVYHGIRAALPHMVESGGGTIINISSGAATGALEGWSHYCATKAAVLSLTRCTHKEYGAMGIRTIGLSPGTVATDMQVQIKASGINPVSQLDPSVHIPAEWVGRSIAWLCTDAGDPYVGDDFSLKSDDAKRAIGLIE